MLVCIFFLLQMFLLQKELIMRLTQICRVQESQESEILTKERLARLYILILILFIIHT